MKKYILPIVLMSLSYVVFSQELTPPQVEGYVSVGGNPIDNRADL